MSRGDGLWRWAAAAASVGLAACAPRVDPLDYGCTELWVEAPACVDAEAFRETVREQLWAPGDEVMGFAFAAGDAQGTMLKGACGLARTARDGGVRVFEPDMGIESGSTSKMLTAVAALRVLELNPSGQGLDTPMVDHLPRGWEPHEMLADAGVVLRDLMQHRSGIVNTGGIGLKPVLQGPEWFNPALVGSKSYANHNIDAVGFMSAYLYDGATLRAQEEATFGDSDYDGDINLAVRDTHYEMLRELTLAPAGIDADCIRFGASSQQVWLYANGNDQRGHKLPSRTNCMTSGFLLSAPQWVDWVAALHRDELISAESVELLDSWVSSYSALGWSSSSSTWRSHSGAYSPEGVGVNTTLVFRQDGYSASIVSNSKNAKGLTSLAQRALGDALAPCGG